MCWRLGTQPAAPMEGWSPRGGFMPLKEYPQVKQPDYISFSLHTQSWSEHLWSLSPGMHCGTAGSKYQGQVVRGWSLPKEEASFSSLWVDYLCYFFTVLETWQTLVQNGEKGSLFFPQRQIYLARNPSSDSLLLQYLQPLPQIFWCSPSLFHGRISDDDQYYLESPKQRLHRTDKLSLLISITMAKTLDLVLHVHRMTILCVVPEEPLFLGRRRHRRYVSTSNMVGLS